MSDKQSKLIPNTQEQRKKKIKTAIAIEKRKNDVFQYKDTEGMREYIVVFAAFFIEPTKELGAYYGVGIGRVKVKEEDKKGDKE